MALNKTHLAVGGGALAIIGYLVWEHTRPPMLAALPGTGGSASNVPAPSVTTGPGLMLQVPTIYFSPNVPAPAPVVPAIPFVGREPFTYRIQ